MGRNCLSCGQELREDTVDHVSGVYLAGKYLDATVTCGNCGEEMHIAGKFSVYHGEGS